MGYNSRFSADTPGKRPRRVHCCPRRLGLCLSPPQRQLVAAQPLSHTHTRALTLSLPQPFRQSEVLRSLGVSGIARSCSCWPLLASGTCPLWRMFQDMKTPRHQDSVQLEAMSEASALVPVHCWQRNHCADPGLASGLRWKDAPARGLRHRASASAGREDIAHISLQVGRGQGRKRGKNGGAGWLRWVVGKERGLLRGQTRTAAPANRKLPRVRGPGVRLALVARAHRRRGGGDRH